MNILSQQQKGFTLIEFVVIMSIFGIVASIALFNFSGFSTNISLTNLTHDVALVIRDAQVYGISNANINNNIDPEDPIKRGVYFKNSGNPGFSNEIVVFDDIDRNTRFNGSELVDTVTVQSSDRISAILKDASNPSSSCPDPEGVRILFQRPDPNPAIYCGNDSWSFAAIVLSKPDNSQQKYVDVYSTGQISVR
jgi:prepilin-type N-terminal cleavage/methylation domain-containing protein